MASFIAATKYKKKGCGYIFQPQVWKSKWFNGLKLDAKYVYYDGRRGVNGSLTLKIMQEVSLVGACCFGYR